MDTQAPTGLQGARDPQLRSTALRRERGSATRGEKGPCPHHESIRITLPFFTPGERELCNLPSYLPHCHWVWEFGRRGDFPPRPKSCTSAHRLSLGVLRPISYFLLPYFLLPYLPRCHVHTCHDATFVDCRSSVGRYTHRPSRLSDSVPFQCPHGIHRTCASY